MVLISSTKGAIKGLGVEVNIPIRREANNSRNHKTFPYKERMSARSIKLVMVEWLFAR